jgi:hypothetical protein
MPTTIIMAPADLLSVRLHASEAQRRCDRITRAVADAMHEALTPERLAYLVVQVRTLDDEVSAMRRLLSPNNTVRNTY